MVSAAFHTCVIGDPCTLSTLKGVQSALTTKEEAKEFHTKLIVNITEELMQKLKNVDTTIDYERHSIVNDESYFALGDVPNDATTLDQLKYIGSIGSDSGYFAVAYDPTKISEEKEALDMVGKEDGHLDIEWEDFMLTLLNDPSLQVDLDSFPLYLFFSRIPEEDSLLSIFGLSSPEKAVYSALIFRSHDCLFCSADSLLLVASPDYKDKIANYISYINSSKDLADTISIFDQTEDEITPLFPHVHTYHTIHKIAPEMPSKVIIVGTSNLPSRWSIDQLAHFVAIGGQLIFVLPEKPKITTEVKDFLGQFGISVSKFPLISKDHFSAQWNEELLDPVFEGFAPPSLHFDREVYPLLLDANRSLTMLWSLISPEPTSFTVNRFNGSPQQNGATTSLIAMFQSRNNGRFTIFSSISILFDEFLYKNGNIPSSNLQSVVGITRWTFKKRGLLDLATFNIFSNNERPNNGYTAERSFRISDTMYFFASLAKYSDLLDTWVPHSPNDLQFEMSIMKPFIRQTLIPLDTTILSALQNSDPIVYANISRALSTIEDKSSILFGRSATPPRTGISTARIFYFRKGFSVIDSSSTILIRHLAHDERDYRFVLGYPCYAVLISSLLAIIFVIFLFLLFKKDIQQKIKHS